MSHSDRHQDTEEPKIEAICFGSPREMGVAQGERLRGKIRESFSVLTRLEAFRLQKPKWMAMHVYRALAERRAAKFLNRGLTDEFAAAQQRLLGLATGAGIRPRRLFLLNAMEAVMSDLSRSTFVPIAAACSAFAATRSASRTGKPIVAHNFDYLPLVQPLYTIRESHPEGKLRSLEFTAAPLCGAIDGINEAGLCITNNYAYTTDTVRPGPTISMLISDTLARCRSVPEAYEFMCSSRRWGGGLLMMADAEGQIGSVEISSTAIELRSPNASDRLFHTNRAQTATVAAVEVDHSAVYSRRAPNALRDRRVHQSADVRAERFRDRLMDTGSIDADQLGELMSDHGPTDEPSSDTICMHSDYWHTTACIQFEPVNRRMRVAYDSACQAQYVDFQL